MRDPPKEGQGESAGGWGESVTVSLGYTSLETFPLSPVPCTPRMGSSSLTQSWAFTKIVLAARSCLTLCDPVDCSPPVSSAFSRQEYWSGLPFPSPGDIPSPRIQPRCPALQADSLPSEPPGKTKSIGVGSLPLVQWIFLSQELNQGLLHFTWIFYQLRSVGKMDVK